MPADDSSSPARASWTPSEIGLAIGSVLLITLVAFQELAATTIMPVVVESFDAAAWYPIASGAALATQLSATVVAGALADWKGPRVVLLAGLVLFAVGLLVCAAGSNVIVFVVGRALQGVGGGLLIVPLYVLVGSVASPRHRPSFFASFSLAWVLPSLVGPAIAGHVTQEWGWRYVFGVVPLLVLVAAILAGTAWFTRRTIERARADLLAHQAVNRLVLARACALVGALLVGGYVGHAVSWLGSASYVAEERLTRSLVAAVAAGAVLAASLLLERACRVPAEPPAP